MRIPSFVVLASLSLVACGSETVTEANVDDAATGGDTMATGDGTSTADSGGTNDGTTGNETTPATDTGGSGADTAAPPGDSAGGINCGNKTCTGGQVCCVTGTGGGATSECAASCADGGVAITCDGPEDCTGSAKICCATAEIVGTFPSCSFKQGTAECKAACTSSVPLTCPATATVRPCHAAADCTETTYNKCCTFESGGNKAQFCAPTQAQALAKSCL